MVEGGAAHKAEQTLFVQRDRRADGGARQIRVSRDGVVISRRFAGVAMTIGVPVAAYRGVALDVGAGAEGAPFYRLFLSHRDADLDVILAESADVGAIAAEWISWAQWLALPRLAAQDGDAGALDGLTARAPLARRRGAEVAKRHPRFLCRRKTGVASRMEAVYAGEREIICYE